MTKWGEMLPNGRNSMNASKADIQFYKRGPITNKKFKSNWANSGSVIDGKQFKIKFNANSITKKLSDIRS